MHKKYIIWIVFLFSLMVLTGLAIVVSLTSGEINISVSELPGLFKSKEGLKYTVLTQIRIPRLLLGIAVGGALSLSGAVLQGIYRNPLVEPYTLGISGGAALGITLAIVLDLHLTLGAIILPVSGFSGAVTVLLLVYFLSIRRGGINVNNMLLIGVMVSFVASSAMMFLMSITTSDNLHSIVFWIMGSLDESNAVLIRFALISSVAGLFITLFFAQPLNALRLGEVRAKHLGIQTGMTIRILFIVASLLTGFSVAVAGVIGFVGLVIPHMVRQIVGNDYRILLIGSFLGGSAFLIFSDTLARTIISPNELPIGVITGIAGGVVFIFVLSRAKSKMKWK